MKSQRPYTQDGECSIIKGMLCEELVHISMEDINWVSFKEKWNATPTESPRKTLLLCFTYSHVSVSVIIVNAKVTAYHYCTETSKHLINHWCGLQKAHYNLQIPHDYGSIIKPSLAIYHLHSMLTKMKTLSDCFETFCMRSRSI